MKYASRGSVWRKLVSISSSSQPSSIGTVTSRAEPARNESSAFGYVGDSTSTVAPGVTKTWAVSAIAPCAPLVIITSSTLVASPRRR